MHSSSPSQSSALMRPNAWLKELTRLKPAHWRWGRSIRVALGMAIPLGFGLALDNIASVLFIAMGAMLQGVGERDAPYAVLFKKAAISAPLGAVSFLLGYLSALPLGVMVGVMACVAFVSAIISSYSAALSIGCLQLLAMGAVFIGNPELAPYWPTGCMLLLGSLLYMVLLALEALFYRQRPDRDMTINLLRALAELARSRAEGRVESARQQVTDQLAALYGLLLQRRSHALGKNNHLNQAAAWLQQADALFALLMSSSDPQALRQAHDQLQSMARAYGAGSDDPIAESADAAQPLSATIAALGQALWGRTAPASLTLGAPEPVHRQSRLALLLDKLTPGRQVVQPALALALCTGLGYSLYWIDDKSHWYWVPMTVCIVMKPDMGSIFGRTVLRCLGTAGGVVVGSAILAWLPPGPLFALIMVLIAAVMPWMGQRSYALFSLGLTPLVLVLIDAVSPETHGVNYAVLRLIDTLLGAAIVLVFGYLIWPRSQDRQMESAFLVARRQIAAYLRASLDAAGNRDAPQVHISRRQAYGALSNMRTRLQQALGDPPPAGREAAAWFPLLAAAERVCDAITAYSSQVHPAPAEQDVRQLQELARVMDVGLDDPGWKQLDDRVPDTSPEARLITQIRSELRQSRRMVEPGQGV
ncbi:FUSC family protein [Bordetella avium]|uniref:FUSC family protein n=1 Tax=Bordetella avium TaxID=521 RepID=UPI000E67F759|nr:FUSC family protein [Bordetella avium]RIQ41278.1 FUSC family protein [Bordetella avium]RIQ45935.1 FUSC family protein [Bordetella avium]RIQ46861.1 FUSC family protein [Bordetella avium]RIQ49615.1 FUSC family protein [Bordetella avium]RIQ61394.1 FUSC family protein [Bordetella avium]